MLKETIHFTDFNDQPAVTVEYFNLTKNEIIDLEEKVDGGLSTAMRKVEDNPTAGSVLALMKILTHASYGIKSDDGKYFEKSDEIRGRFISSAYYDDFLFSLLENDAVKGLAFIRGVIPPSLLEAAERQIASTQAAQQYAPDARAQFAQAQQAAAAVAHPEPAPLVPQVNPSPEDKSYQEFLAWKASQEKQTEVPASQNAFRVPEQEQPLQGLQQ